MLKRKFFVFLVVFPLCMLVSCKWEFAMTGKADFSDRYLHEMLATYNAPGMHLEPGNEAADSEDDFSFFGVGREDIEEMIRNFGGCLVDGRANLVVEVIGLSVKKVYLPSGSEIYGRLDCKNPFSAKVFTLAENMKREFQGLEVNFSDDFKIAELRYTYTSDVVVFDDKKSGETVKVSEVRESSNSKDTSMKIRDGKIILEFLKTVSDSEMVVVLEKLR